MAYSVPTRETQIPIGENQPLREQRHFLLNFRTGRNDRTAKSFRKNVKNSTQTSFTVIGSVETIEV